MKRWIALLLAAMLALSAAAAWAENGDDEAWDDEEGWDSEGEEAWDDEEFTDEAGLGLSGVTWLKKPVATISYEDLGVAKGTTFPVYGAPYEDAWRGAKGKASVSTAESFRLLGWNTLKDWLLIEYDIKPGEKRIGWIQARSEKARKSRAWFPLMTRNLLKAAAKTALTDDPNGSRRTIATLAPGDTVIGLHESGGWVCVETFIGGKPVWAFCKPDSLQKVPLWHNEGRTVVVHEGVTMLGDYIYDTLVDEDGFRDYEYVPEPPGTVCFRLFTEYLYDLDTIRLPESLRYIGEASFGLCGMETLAIPEGVHVSYDVCYGVDIGELIVPASVTDISGFYSGEYCRFGRFTVAEGNPVYCSVDGVLFSADRKTLIRYPNERPGEHYDVPAGTEAIEARAFDDDDVDLPLKTISLPMGLKSIGGFAFSGCGRLVSMTVPLTVTELSEHAFVGCVSLEQLSLPPGLEIEPDPETGSGDYGRYHGDNGLTGIVPDEDEDFSRDWYGTLDSPEGEGMLILYADAACSIPLTERKVGSQVRVTGSAKGAFKLYFGYNSGEAYSEAWVPARQLQPVTGETLFRITAARFSPGAEPIEADVYDPEPDLSHPEEWSLDPFNTVGGEVGFSRTVEVTEDGEVYTDTEYLTISVFDTTLWRARTGDDRILGILAPKSASGPVWYADVPGGERTGHVWPGEQAEVREARDGWLRVRTALGSFWVAEGDFAAVEQE